MKSPTTGLFQFHSASSSLSLTACARQYDYVSKQILAVLVVEISNAARDLLNLAPARQKFFNMIRKNAGLFGFWR
jgi:hypothetical protein